ncbi:hypothetical protein KSZ_00770 [Dictyobacter formicarum]|uniref:Uncharacterized protein n=1 Tax=Dictyobacter formicarum TaxID=2778368 RepID=A0ABQ3V8K5_9CHLR|nr:hypothetical protein KSZ_00770 [Dictyobacter formicarum]
MMLDRASDVNVYVYVYVKLWSNIGAIPIASGAVDNCIIKPGMISDATLPQVRVFATVC